MTLPFRLKLTVWYTILLALALAVFSVAVYLLMADALLSNLGASLQARTDQVALGVEVSGNRVRVQSRDEETGNQFIPYMVLSPTGHVIAGAPPRTLLRWALRNSQSLRPGFHVRTVNDLRVGTRSIDRRGRAVAYISVWQPLDPVNQARQSLLLVLLITGPVLLVVAGLGGWAIAGRALAPVVEVTEAAAAISASDLTRRVQEGKAEDELSRLASTFNAMIGRLESAVQRERRFTADASHELRSPLAVIRAEATLATEKLRSPQEYQRALQVIDDQATAMEELIAQLLLLARGSSSLHQLRETIPLEDVVEEAVAASRSVQVNRDVRIEVDVPADVVVDVSLALLARAIRNILDNAVRFSPEGATVRVTGRLVGHRVVLTVEDAGPGVLPEHREHIFEPFYQASPVRTPGETHGLGLAICKLIVVAHGGDVSVEPAPGGGALFRIDLPEASHRAAGQPRVPA